MESVAHTVIAVHGAELCYVGNIVAVPVLKQGDCVSLLTGIAGGAQFHHILEQGQQVFHGLDFRIAQLFVQIPPQVDSRVGVYTGQGFCGLASGNLGGSGPNAFLFHVVLVGVFNGLHVGLQVLLALQIGGHVGDQLSSDQVLQMTSLSGIDDQIAQVAGSGTGLEQGVTAARHVGGNDVQFHVELFLDDLAEPAALDSLVVCLRIEHINGEEFLVLAAAFLGAGSRSFCLRAGAAGAGSAAFAGSRALAAAGASGEGRGQQGDAEQCACKLLEHDCFRPPFRKESR